MHNLIPDLNEEPPRHNSFVSQTSMWHDSSMDEQIKIERLRKQIPKVIHPYILVSGIQNVGSDGNCGFRAVALGLGLSEDQWPRIRSDLVRELEARQRQYKPSQSDSHETILVAHVDGNHYIRVALREGFPLPLTHPLWITYRSDIASGWEDKFVSRQNEFREYYYRTPESYDLT
ncbi:RNA-directed DNA polymerase, eukaryota, reverse transcriptase zinc-binding domain protein [Tanacetum coccineum]